jgi:uncharacterized protein DUF3574
MLRLRVTVVVLLVTILGITPAAAAGPAQPDRATPTASITAAASSGELWHRTELYFGRNRPGGEVTEEEFQHFLDVEVTKRFPDGLTLLSGLGQFREESGAITQEKSKILILLYPLTDRQANREIEEIRQAYKDQFQQSSVLRVDDFQRVSF